MRDSVTRLAIGVESISGDLREIRTEIHQQVSGLKIEINDQVSGLKQELHQQQLNHNRRMELVEGRIDGLGARIDVLVLSDAPGDRRSPAGRREWEGACEGVEAADAPSDGKP